MAIHIYFHDAHGDVTRYKGYIIVENGPSFDLYTERLSGIVKSFKSLADAKAHVDKILRGR